MSDSSSIRSIVLPVIALVAVGVCAWYILGRDEPPAPAVVEPVVTAPVVVAPQEPADVLTANQEPGHDELAAQAADAGTDLAEETTVTPTEPLPALDASDEFVKNKLLALKWKPGLAALFVNEEMIRRFVVQVDNIAQGRIVLEQNLFRGLKTDFKVIAAGENYQLDPKNYSRYEPYLALLESVPASEVGQVYRELYPLLQAAYAELGYGDVQFHDTLQKAFKVLIDAPEVSDSPTLTLNSVYYSFANAETEQLNLAQKQMIRLGQKNELRFKRLLVQYQQQLTRP